MGTDNIFTLMRTQHETPLGCTAIGGGDYIITLASLNCVRVGQWWTLRAASGQAPLRSRPHHSSPCGAVWVRACAHRHLRWRQIMKERSITWSRRYKPC